jgi:hypothetical protein
MLIPKRVGPEQILSHSPERSDDFLLARFSAGVGPAQVAQTWVKVGDAYKRAVGVVYHCGTPGLTGATWRVVLDDGTLTTYDSIGSDHARNASCSVSGAFAYEDRGQYHGQSAFPPYGGRIMLRLGPSPFSQPPAPDVGPAYHVIGDLGAFFDEEDREKSWNFTPQNRVFAPTVCAVRGSTLALWNRGSYEPNSGSRTSTIRGTAVPGTHRAGQPIETFDLEATSHTDDRFNANLHAFNCSLNVETDATEVWMETVGLVNSNANGLINIRVFDILSGRFDPTGIYSSEWSPAPGHDPAGVSGGGHPIVAWIGRDDGDVHVVIAQRRARLAAGIGSVFAQGTLLVANQPAPKGHSGNRRPALANFVVAGAPVAPFVVAWEAPRPEGARAGMYSDIKARVFSLDGVPQSDEFTINATHVAGRAAPNLTPVDNGFYAVWMDNSGPAEAGQQPGLGAWLIKGQRWGFDVAD